MGVRTNVTIVVRRFKSVKRTFLVSSCVFFVSLSCPAALFRRFMIPLVCLCVTVLRQSFREPIAEIPDWVARSDAAPAWVVAASCVAAAVWTWGAGALGGVRARRPLRSFQTYPLRSFISVCTVKLCACTRAHQRFVLVRGATVACVRIRCNLI